TPLATVACPASPYRCGRRRTCSGEPDAFQSDACGAEGATAPESLRPPDRAGEATLESSTTRFPGTARRRGKVGTDRPKLSGAQTAGVSYPDAHWSSQH